MAPDEMRNLGADAEAGFNEEEGEAKEDIAETVAGKIEEKKKEMKGEDINNSMSSSDVLPPNPCLVAILLVVKINSEPRIVFHYPPRPGKDNTHITRYLAAQEKEKEGSSSTDDDSSTSHDEVAVDDDKPKESNTGGNTPELDVEDPASVSPEKNAMWDSQYGKTKWSDLFGLPSDGLARLLCPPPTSDKQKFEMSIDDKVFVGRPVFAREGESWQKKKKKKKQMERKSKAKNTATDNKPTEAFVKSTWSEATSAHEVHTSTDASEHENDHSETPPSQQETQTAAHTGRSTKSGIEPSTQAEQPKVAKDVLNMFHMVFVLNPPPLEYQLRVKDMYDHVIRKFSKALKWVQARSNYVLREASLLHKEAPLMKRALAEDQSLATLYHRYQSRSLLAKAISTLYNSISTSRIAHVNLTQSSSLSFQIPVPTSISVLPGPLSHQMPGLWLTTATSLPVNDEVDTTNSQLASQFTLLLLSDLPIILSEINDASSPLSTALTHYLQVSKPTKSFLQISQSSGIPLPDIQFLASHLIYWRKARAIPPLHQRDTYIVSPNADMSRLMSATSKFAKAFPALPSLPKIMNLLSTPRAYSTLIPSKDHKEAFMNILAWLLRDGWVTQLRTFVWVRVPPHIKATVESQKGDAERSLESSIEQLPPPLRTEAVAKGPPNTLAVPPPSSSPTSSTASAHTTIPFRTSSQEGTPPPPSSSSSSLIQNPRQASGMSSRYLSAISMHVLRRQGVEGQKAWNRWCLRYFDGKHAVETIAVQESWKRKRVAEFITMWEAEGLLLKGRHW
ncbi:MAG: hypothetical protein LQ341_003152 [Variospora aurantia]|nr:MAG: hypothetical protein LQ341_003152 [Variospora aurantia]